MTETNSTIVALRAMMKLMVLFAVLAIVWMFFGSTSKEQQATPKQQTLFNISSMQPGDHQLVKWQGKPVFIVYRKTDWERSLASADVTQLKDPDSLRSTQPQHSKNKLRSREAGWFVSLGLGTGAGCTLDFFMSEEPPGVQGTSHEEAPGVAFIDVCDKSRFDLAGRVFEGQTAKRNLVIPDWQLLDGQIALFH